MKKVQFILQYHSNMVILTVYVILNQLKSRRRSILGFYELFLHKHLKNFRFCFIPDGLLIGKTANRDEIEKKKSALGDIKNAQTTAEEKVPMKTEHIEIVDEKYEREFVDEEYETEFASSKDVDYHQVWAEKLALSDDEINRWITMLNIARDTTPDDEILPPPIYIDPMPFENCKFS